MPPHRNLRAVAMVCLLAALAAAGEPVRLREATEPLRRSRQPTGPELVANGGFEHVVTETGAAVRWRGFSSRDWGECEGTLRVVEDQPHGGDHCAELSGVRVQYAVGQVERTPVERDQAYLLSGWVRPALGRGEAAWLVASWFGEGGFLGLSRSRALRGRKPWTRVAVVLAPESRPEGAREVLVSFRVTSGSGRGRAWADDLSLRACRVPPPPPFAVLGRQRLLDMARELLVERRVWAERRATLERRRADVERLLAEGGSFAELARRHGEAVRRRRFLTHVARPRAELERDVPAADEQVRARVAAIGELPALRAQCFAELEALLALKRRLDAEADLRRFYLWAQLAALRGEPPPPPDVPPPPKAPPAFQAAARTPPEEPTAELAGLDVLTRLDRATGVGTVALAAPPHHGGADGSLQAGLFDADGGLVAFASQALGAEPARLVLRVGGPRLWFPDCPHLYTLRIGLFRDGRAVDWLERPVAFREIRIVESDVVPTLRHAWGWAPADYTFAVNGQPYFPAGTVCGGLSAERLEDAGQLFRELWLDFQRTYGTFLPRLEGGWGDAWAREGLTCLASLRPDYAGIRRYVSSRRGLADYRELARSSRGLATHPALLTVEVGNEAELAVWGADLAAVYGRHLWHGFNEVTRALREAMGPAVPVGYVRAAHFGRVLPVPRTDYSGVNQYTGRYWGRRATLPSDLAALAQAAALDHRPIAVTEWNGPKYSWATSGVGGVDEEGAAQYLFDYWRRMTRTPGIVLSTEFVLNWVVTPVEDLTTVPLAEGLKRRAGWRWSLQKGTPWYPHIWPDLLTDTPGRRAMRGFQSPLFQLCQAPGEIVVVQAGKREAVGGVAPALRLLGRRTRVVQRSDAGALEAFDANVLLVGGLGDDQPPVVRRLEAMGVVGRTTAAFPASPGYLVQRRVHPWFPDRVLVVVTAKDWGGMIRARSRLLAVAGDLGEVLARQATCRRAIALIDDDAETRRVFARYVMELPPRGRFLGWDNLRTRLAKGELLDDDGRLRPHWADLGAVLVTARRQLSLDERELLDALPRRGVHVVWSAATLEADPEAATLLGVSLGRRRPLSGHYAVEPWAQEPLAVPELGDVAAGRVARFARLKTDSTAWQRAMTLRELAAPEWLAAATAPGQQAVAVFRVRGQGREWVVGADLAAAARALWRTTHRGVNHPLYDRDTACGLERLFRLVANAMARHPRRRPGYPRLRADIATDKQSYAWGDTLRVEVRVRDADGEPRDAAVRVGFLAGRGRSEAVPRRWAQAERAGRGVYVVEAPVARGAEPDALVPPPPPNAHFRGQRLLAVFADVARQGWAGDWTARVVRVTDETDEPARLAELARVLQHDLLTAILSVEDRERWVELDATLTAPAAIQAGRPARLGLRIDRIESDTGNDWLEHAALVLRSADGQEAALPVAEGRILAAPRAQPVRERPDQTTVVRAGQPARFDLLWPTPRAGTWTASLRYRYTDDYHVQDTRRLPRDDPFPRLTLSVAQ